MAIICLSESSNVVVLTTNLIATLCFIIRFGLTYCSVVARKSYNCVRIMVISEEIARPKV